MELDSPPFLQIALDLVDEGVVENIISQIPKSEQILIEAGTPLIKKFGLNIIRKFRTTHSEAYIIADMKTLDVGSLEVQIVVEATANAITISGLAPIETIESALETGREKNCDVILDFMNVQDPLSLISKLTSLPKILLFHRGIDQEGRIGHPWHIIKTIKANYPEILVAVAGGLNLKTSSEALYNGADIIVIGRAITQSHKIKKSINEFLDLLKKTN